MAELKYEGNTVNSVVSQLTSIAGKFDPLANTVKSCTGVMVGRRGFNLVGGGVTSDSISQSVGSCSESLGELVKDIRTKQVAILTYSQDEDAINSFVKSLSRLEYDALDLSGIENKISGWTKLSFAAKGVFASVGTFAAGFLEGGANFIETVADTGAILVTGAASIFTKPYDLINGTNVTDEMWESTKAYVAEEQVASIADKFYANTEAGQFLKENAYGFDMVRGVGRGVGYSTAMIAAGNVFAGAGGLTGAAKAARLGKVLPAMSGVLGFGNSSEEGWADGASTEKGLMYGVAGGTWEAIQWGVGVKINGMGSHIDDIAQVGAKQVFKDSTKRVILDTVDSGVEGFVQPGLTMIYKQYEGDTLAAQYANAFETNGGWNGVIQQAAIGGFMSGSSEIGDVFKYNRNLVKTSKASSTKKADATKAAVVDQKADTVLKGKPGYGENGMPLLNVKPGDDVTVRTEVTYDKTPTSGDVRVRETYAENGMPILDVKPRSDANVKPQTTVSPKTTKGFDVRPAKAASTATGDTKISTGASARTTASTKPQVYVDSRMPKFDRNSLDAALSSVSSKPQVDPNVTYAKNGMPVFELDNIGHSAIASNAVNLGSRSAGVDLATGLDVGDFSFDTGNITQASAGVASLAGLGKMGFDLASGSGSDFNFDVRLKSEIDMRNALDDVKNFGTKTPKFNDSISGKKAPDVRTKGTDVRTKDGSSSTTSSRVTSRAQAEADMKNSLRDLDKVKTKTTESKPLPTRRKDFDQIGKKSVTDRNIRDFELMENSRTKMTPLSNSGLDGVINRQRVEADGSRVINNYNSDGKLISKYIIKPDGTHEVMLPKGEGNKFETINVIKRSRPVENISFDSKGNAITERFFDDGTYYRAVNEESGRAIETVHNSKGNIIRQTEVRPDGSYREVTYDNSGNVISNRSSGSNFASDYDSTPMTPSQRVVEDIPNLDGNVSRQRVEADGTRVIDNYDADGNLMSKHVIHSDGTHEVMLPLGEGNRFDTIKLDEQNRPVENVSFDSKGNVITERYFEDGTCHRFVSDETGKNFETVYDSNGNLIRQTEVGADGSYREIKYDDTGKVISDRSSGSNQASDYGSSPVTPSQRVVEDIPNLDGNVSRQRVEADGTRVIDNYDADGNLMSKHVIHSDGTHEVMLPLGEGNRFDTIKLDEQNRPIENVSFDSKGNVITERYFEDGTCHRFVSDETGKNFETVYDSNGNLIRQTEVGADGSYREIKYDDTGKVISDRSSGSNQASDYGSSPMGSTAKAAAAGVPLTKGVENIVSRPDGSTSSYKVEADGRVIESDYNYRGELIGRRETLPDGSLIEYKTFDKGTLTTSFDKMGNITKAVETNVDGTVKTTRFDGKGNYDKITVDSSGRLIEKQWNVDGNTNIHKFNPDGSSSLRVEGKDGSLHIKDFRTDGSIRERIYNTDKTTEARVTNPDKSTRVTKFDTNKRMYERIETTRDGVVTTSKFKTDGTTIVKTDYLDRHSVETVYNSNNQMISSHEINPNGTYVNKKYDVSGKVIEKISSTETGSIYIERYNSDSTYTKRVIESGNDVISETTFDQRGKVVKESLEYKDGSMFEKKYNSDGTTEIKTVNADKTYDIKKIDSNGKILEQTWTSKDGTIRRQITNSDGTYSRHTEDADGRVRDSVLNKNKIMTSQTEVRPDGSKQYFVRNADGSTNITEYRADGSIRAVDNRPDGTYNKVLYDKNGRIVEQSWSDTNGTISTQKTNSDGTYSRHVVENNGTYRDLVIDKDNRLVSKVEHRTDGTVITTNRRADGGMVVEEKYKTGASMKNTYDRNNNLVEQVYRNTDGSITRKVFNAPTPNDGSRVQPQQRPQPQQVQKSQPVQMPVYRNADEVIRGLSNPLNEANLERIVRRINDGRTGSTYNKIVSVNTTTPKILPTQSAVDSFYKKFASGDYLFHDQRPYFDHFRSWDFDSKVEVTDRLYLNMKDFSDTYKFCELFATECDKRGIPFYLKTATALGGKADIHPKQLMRDESIVIYSGKNYLSDYTNIASEIVAKYGFKLEEPPVLTGRLKNNIGYGAEPLSFNGRCSFNSLRSNIIDAAINKLNANYRQRGLPLYSGNYYTELKNLIIEFGRQCGIDASNFCNNIK